MAKSTPQMCYQHGDGRILYRANSFIYELTTNLIFKNEGRMELEACRYISSQVPLKFKKTYAVEKLSKQLTRTKEIELVCAPMDYITKNNFVLTELKNKKTKNVS